MNLLSTMYCLALSPDRLLNESMDDASDDRILNENTSTHDASTVRRRHKNKNQIVKSNNISNHIE